jgi:hypothetical protein
MGIRPDVGCSRFFPDPGIFQSDYWLNVLLSNKMETVGDAFGSLYPDASYARALGCYRLRLYALPS